MIESSLPDVDAEFRCERSFEPLRIRDLVFVLFKGGDDEDTVEMDSAGEGDVKRA